MEVHRYLIIVVGNKINCDLIDDLEMNMRHNQQHIENNI